MLADLVHMIVEIIGITFVFFFPHSLLHFLGRPLPHRFILAIDFGEELRIHSDGINFLVLVDP